MNMNFLIGILVALAVILAGVIIMAVMRKRRKPFGDKDIDCDIRENAKTGMVGGFLRVANMGVWSTSGCGAEDGCSTVSAHSQKLAQATHWHASVC